MNTTTNKSTGLRGPSEKPKQERTVSAATKALEANSITKRRACEDAAQAREIARMYGEPCLTSEFGG